MVTNKRSEGDWTGILALVGECHEKNYAPSRQIWQKIVAMVKDMGLGDADGEDNVPGSVEESRRKLEEGFCDKFEQDGFSPEQAQRMAEDAASVPFERSWP